MKKIDIFYIRIHNLLDLNNQTNFHYYNSFPACLEVSVENYVFRKSSYKTLVRRNDAARRVVAVVRADFFGIVRVCPLFDLGGVSGRALFLRRRWSALSVAVLFAGNFRCFPICDVRHKTRVDSRLAAVVARAFDSLCTRRFSFHLLLLSRRVLQGVLG